MSTEPVVRKKSWPKKIAIGFGVFLGLLLAVIVILPFVVNVDSYRPQIVQIANEKINGKLEMGKLSLSLWGQIKVVVDGFTLSDSAGRKVVAAKDVYFHVPFLSVFSGSPVLTFKMARPEVNVVKDKSGKMNVLTLMKPSQPVSPTAEAEPGGGVKSLPGVVTSARLGVELKDAHLSYRDQKTDLVSKVDSLNVQVRDISLSKTMKIAVWADLDTRMGKTFAVKGPVRLTGEIAPTFQGTEFQSATIDLNADANSLDIAAGEMFHKKAGIATNAQAKLKVTLDSADIEGIKAAFHNATLSAKGTVSGFSKPEGDPAFKLEFQSNDVALAPWTELVPMLKDFQLEGNAYLRGSASGTASKPEYAVDMGAKDVRAAAPMLKAKPEIQAVVKVVTDQVKQMSMTLKAPGNQLAINGTIVSFAKPKFDVSVTSTGMDLDQWLDLPKPQKTAATSAEAKTATEGKGAGGAAPQSDFDALLDPLRKNEIAAKASGAIKMNLAMVKVRGVSMTEMNGLMTLKDLTAAVERFSMKIFGGSIQSSLSAQLRPKAPTYRFGLAVQGLSLQKAVESQFALFKNTLLGTADFKMDGTGASFNPDPAKRNLNAKGTLKVTDGSFATIDIGKVAADALNSSIAKTAEKIAALRGKKVNAPGNSGADYQVISSDFTINGGKFVAPNFTAVSKPGKGIDLSGSTTVGLSDYSLSADWVIIDTHNVTKVKDLSVTEQGITVNNILAENGQVVKIPIKVTGTVFAPKVDYAAVPESLAKVALNNIARAAGDKAKAEAQKAIDAQVQKAAPQIQQAVKGLGKKLFGK
jgi:hypothetical protein